MEDIARDYLRLREKIAEYAQGHERYALDPDNEDDPERIEDSRILADNLRTILVPADQRDQLTDIVALLPARVVEQVKEWKTSSLNNSIMEELDGETATILRRKQELEDDAVILLGEIAECITPSAADR